MSDDNDWETAELDVPVPKAARKPQSVWAPPPASHPSAGPSEPKILSRNSAAQAGGGGGGDEDEWFRGGPQGNRQIWDSANRASNSPMSTQAPPKLLILKRPNAPKAEQPRSGSATPKSMTQREEEYRLARERIFGASEGGDSEREPVQPVQPGQPGQPSRDQREREPSREGKERTQRARRSGTSTPNSNPKSGRSSPSRQVGADDLAREVDRLAIRQGTGAQYYQPQPYGQYTQPQGYYQPQPRPPQRYQQQQFYGQKEYPPGVVGGVAPGAGPAYSPGAIGPPSGRSSGSPAGPVPALRGGVSPGVLRQPRGPGQGGGFGNGNGFGYGPSR